ncbi:MAG TPA: hypothetical protein DDX54_01010 [Rhodospirillaceae bacterium]|nr:hypothetical protein [Rhodospirillaceae bacterium]
MLTISHGQGVVRAYRVFFSIYRKARICAYAYNVSRPIQPTMQEQPSIESLISAAVRRHPGP